MTRLLTAIVLLPAILAVVWFLPPSGTLVLAMIAAELGMIEYRRIAAALGAHVPRVTSVFVLAACLGVGTMTFPGDAILLLALVTFGSLAVFAGIPGAGALGNSAAAIFAVVYLGLPLGAIAAIHTLGGRDALILLMLTIVVSDSAQYYTGRAFGRAPLAPAISPKKTREGALGGLVFGSAAMIAGARFVFPAAPPLATWGAAIAVVALGMIGDLFESLLKRSAGVKDSSALIPGHGGILDRIDSWLFAGPAYYVFTSYLHAG
jgi:phosphatidate cytidylyltransferase